MLLSKRKFLLHIDVFDLGQGTRPGFLDSMHMLNTARLFTVRIIDLYWFARERIAICSIEWICVLHIRYIFETCHNTAVLRVNVDIQTRRDPFECMNEMRKFGFCC